MKRRLRAAWARAARAVPWRRVARWSAAICVVVYVLWLALDLTPVSWWIDEARFARPVDAFDVVDRHGAVLRHARVGGVDRRWIAIADVDPKLGLAFVAAEDARFREHRGVDPLAMLRAAASAVRPWGRRSGGSTITQQVVKLVYGRPNGLLSKPLEILRARALERRFTKDEILEQYVNRVPYGDRIVGVARASESYFGHPASDLTLAEAAMLAGIPQAPSATEPRRHLARARRRAAYVLGRMVDRGLVDDEARTAALAGPFVRVVAPRPDEAPRFVDAALSQWRVGALDRRGGDLRTSLDVALQGAAEESLRTAVRRFGTRGVTNAAAIVVANATGEILAYVGAARRDGPGGSLDLLARPRQPGSTLKPFAYELFFERGGTAATLLDDVPFARTGARGATFDAKDYDGRERGPVRARTALAASLNLAALDVATRVGQDALVGRLAKLRARGADDPSRYGAAAVLGGLDVTPTELAGAYVTLARGGTKVPLVFAEAAAKPGVPVMRPGAAAVTIDVLSDARARAEGFGSDLVDLAGGARFALKTGTSSGWRDAWAAAFDETVTVVVWMGDPEGRPLAAVSGFEASAPVAARILGAARARRLPLAGLDAVLPTLTSASICAESGLRPGPDCKHVVQERFAPDAIPSETCSAHDEHGDLVLPARYADWIARTHPAGIARTSRRVGDAPEPIEVHQPRDGARWIVDPLGGATVVPLRARRGGEELRGASWRVDDEPVRGDAWTVRPGDHVVVAEWQGKRSRPVTVHVTSAR